MYNLPDLLDPVSILLQNTAGDKHSMHDALAVRSL